MTTFRNLLITLCIASLGGYAIYSFPGYVSDIESFAIGAFATTLILSLINCGIFKRKGAKGSSKTIYVGNLPYRANEHDVKELFEEFGEVFAVRLMMDKRTGKRRGFGFVVMDNANAADAIDALNNCEFGDRTLKVREANDPKKSEIY